MHSKSRGFTLIELMLSMAFLSLLLIAITTTTIHVSRLFDKGRTLKMVNQTGRDVADAVRRDARSASNLGDYFVAPSEDVTGNMGRVCFGSVSYVWNEALAIQADTGVRYGGTPAGDQVILARVNDVNGEYCQTTTGPGAYRQDVPTSATEMVQASGRDLAIHSLTFEPLVTIPGAQAMYILRFTLGTNDAGTIDTVDTSCKPPNDAGSNFEYCAVNNFEQVLYVR